MSPELTVRRVDVTERGPASRLSEKVNYQKSRQKMVRQRRSIGEGSREKVQQRRSVGEGPSKRVRRRRSTGKGSSEKVYWRMFGREGFPERGMSPKEAREKWRVKWL